MPFRSEKQRRYLWATQPDLARRWAHEYPQKKKLPLYVKSKDEADDKATKSDESSKKPVKKAENIMAVSPNQHHGLSSVGRDIYVKFCKNAESSAVKINIPRSDKPVSAGEESISAKTETEKTEGAEGCDNNESAHVSSLMAKLSVVLSQKIQQAIADDEAAQAGAEAQPVPQNAGLKDYPPSSPAIPPPMGMTAGAVPADPAQGGTYAPVGGGSHPSANPINSYGGLSVNGDINGNAAFGAPGGAKTAGKLGLWDRIRAKKERGEKPAKPGDKDYPDSKSWKKVTGISEKKSAEGQKAVACSCGCGDTVETCKCGPDCSCRKPGGSCYKGEKQAVNWRALMQNISKNSKTYLDRLTGKSIIPLKQKARLADERHNKWLRVEGKVTEKYKPSVRDPNPPPIVKLFYGEHDGGAGNAGGLATARWLGNPRSPVDRSFKMLNKAQRAMWDEEKAIASTRRNTGYAGLGALGLGGLAANYLRPEKQASSPAWQRSEGKNDEGGLNAKGRASYNKATGGNLKAPVTESNPKGDRAKRQNSFCSRMCGMKRVNTGSKTKSDPDSRINKSLRKWNCKCSSAMEFGMKMAAPTSSLIPTFQQAAREGLAGMRNRFKILENMSGVRDRLLSGDLYPMPPVDKHINVVNRGATHAADVGRVLQRMLKQMRVPADKVQETVGAAPIAWLPTDKRILGNRPQLKQSAAGTMEFGMKMAARGDMTQKLLSRLGRDIFFKTKTLVPEGKAVTGGWQTAHGVIGTPGFNVQHYFDPRSVKEINTPAVTGNDLLIKAKNLLPLSGGMPERGGGLFDNNQKDLAAVLRQMRAATKKGSFEELGGDVGSLAGLPAGLGGIAAVQHLSDPKNVDKLRFNHLLRAGLTDLRGKTGLPVSLKQRLGQMLSKGVATGLKYLPKTPAGRMAAGIGAPLAAFLGAGLAGNAAGSAVGRQFDK